MKHRVKQRFEKQKDFQNWDAGFVFVPEMERDMCLKCISYSRVRVCVLQRIRNSSIVC